MAKDLHVFLEEYEKKHPDDVIHVEKEISTRYEITAMVKTRNPGLANRGGAMKRRIPTTAVMMTTIATVRSMLDVRSGLFKKNTT